MKAYRRTDGTRFVFRLRDHWERLNRSAARLTMPEVPYELFSELLQTLLHREENFFPPSLQQALYIRPVYFATDPWLGVRPSETYLLLIYVTPVGPYYSGEVRAFVEPELTRAAIGGTGAIKAAGNYAAALLSTKKAQAVGCSVSLWLDATHRELIEEFSTMNAFFVEKGGRLLTPPLERGTILAGITRDTILFLAAKVGLEVEERELSIYEITEGIAQGRITEVFGTGTAATIMPVRALYFAGKFWTLPSENPVAQKLAQAYRALLSGDIPAPAGWIHRV
jgi:branched-chain amino acid aminotransferase